jgi:hypothetical protein
VRAIAISALVSCAGKPSPPPPTAPIENRVVAGPAAEPAECDDVVEGPLYAPVIQYLVTAGELAARTIREHQGEFLRCYTQRARYLPNLEGRVTVTFTIETGGKPGRVRTVGFDADVDRCICEKMRTLVFESLAAGEKISFPFVFKPY